MLSSFISELKNQSLLQKGEKVLAAVSGGKDSMVMLHLLVSAGFEISVAHINYQLRGADSDADEALVKATCKQLNLPYHIQRAQIEKSETNIQETARAIRYDFFQTLCSEFDYQKIATAHHANDALETLFIQLMRGTGIHGLKAIPLKRDNIIRPILWAGREEIDAFAEKENIAFRTDISNQSDNYLRNRIRHHLLPMINNTIDPTAIQKLKSSMNMLTDDAAAVQSMASSLLTQDGQTSMLDLTTLPQQSAHTWVYHAISKFGFNRIQAQNICGATENKKQVFSSDYCCTKVGKSLIIEQLAAAVKSIEISGPGEYEFDKISIHVKLVEMIDGQNPLDMIPSNATNAAFDAEMISFPLTFGPFHSSESMQPLGNRNKVKLKKLISSIASKPCGLKDTSGEIIWLYKQRISEKAKLSMNTKTVLMLETQAMHKSAEAI
jgi:tRNA(Ile)-lysidine synthase